MKILTAKQVYDADKATIEKQHITPLDLMERAAMRVFEWIHERLGAVQVPVHVFCGVGNNGGDGMVLARLLYEHGYLVNCYVVNYSDTRSKCFLINYDRFKELKHPWPVLLDEQSELPELPDDQLVIDCIFGIGLNRPLDGWVKKLI